MPKHVFKISSDILVNQLYHRAIFLFLPQCPVKNIGPIRDLLIVPLPHTIRKDNFRLLSNCVQIASNFPVNNFQLFWGIMATCDEINPSLEGEERAKG